MRLLLPAVLLLCVHLPGTSCFLTAKPALVPKHFAAAAGTGSSLDEVKADTSDAQQPIRRVAIVGAGIAGLSLAHALESTCDGIEVTIFDSRPEPLDFSAGAGVQINGGASVLRRINPELHGKVARAALPLKDIRSRAKPWFQSGGTNGNPFSTLLEINLESAIKSTGGDVEKALIVDGEVQAFTIMRGALQKILLEALPSSTQVRLGKQLSNIQSSDDRNGAVCTFNNDDSLAFGPFDIVCGCDGIQSAVKQYVDSYKISSDTKSSKSALYSGIRIRYAIEDCDEVGDVAELRQYFGDGAYGLYGTYGAGEGETRKRGAYLIFNDKDYIGPFPKRKEEESDTGTETKAAEENAEWAESGQVDMKADTLLRMKNAGLPDEELRPVIEAADKFFELGVYFHNPFSFRGWTRKIKDTKGTYACLLGDSAHAMPPFLGQGANQAIQDAYCLATKIAEHNANCSGRAVPTDGTEESKASTLEELLKEYEKLRWSPTASITLKSILLGYLETGGEGLPSKLRDSVFFTLGKLGIARKVFLDGATPKF